MVEVTASYQITEKPKNMLPFILRFPAFKNDGHTSL